MQFLLFAGIQRTTINHTPCETFRTQKTVKGKNMKNTMKFAIVGAASLVLAACGGKLEQAEKLSPGGTEFQQALYTGSRLSDTFGGTVPSVPDNDC